MPGKTSGPGGIRMSAGSLLNWSRDLLRNPLPPLRHSISLRPSAPLRLEIDEGALVANWRHMNALSGPAQASAVVKAEAYGIGAKRVVPPLRDAGCRDFFVSYLSEAADLSQFVQPSQVAFLHGPLTRDEAEWANVLGFRPVINSLQQAAIWKAVGGGTCDIMVDTGINRLGLTLEDLRAPDVQSLDIDILHSHLSSADEESPANASQFRKWKEARELVPHKRGALANSAGITLGPEYHGDLTRPGIAVYGGTPCPALAGSIRQVVYPKALIMQVRNLEKGDAVGYNRTFVAPRAMRVAVVGIGYADGYLRCWSGRGAMEHEGQLLPVVGRVSMDMSIVDIGAAASVGEGDWLSVAYDLPVASNLSGLSQYELLTLLAHRFSR